MLLILISPFLTISGVNSGHLQEAENKKHSNTELIALHLSDDALTVLKDGKFNHRLLSELICHKQFRRLMVDAEIYVDRIADSRISDLNAMLEVTRKQVQGQYAPDADDLYAQSSRETISLTGARTMVEELSKRLPKVEWGEF